jgi:hypothetical protein
MFDENPFLVLGVSPTSSQASIRDSAQRVIALRRLFADTEGAEVARTAQHRLGDCQSAFDWSLTFPALGTAGLEIVAHSGFADGLVSTEEFDALLEALAEVEAPHTLVHTRACFGLIESARMIRAASNQPKRERPPKSALTKMITDSLVSLDAACSDPRLQIELRLQGRRLNDPRLTPSECLERVQRLPNNCATQFTDLAVANLASHRLLSLEIMQGVLANGLSDAIKSAGADRLASALSPRIASAIDRFETQFRAAPKSSLDEFVEMWEGLKATLLPDLDTVLSCDLKEHPSVASLCDRAALLLDRIGYQSWHVAREIELADRCVETASRFAISANARYELQRTIQVMPGGDSRLRRELAQCPIQLLRSAISSGKLAAAKRHHGRLTAARTPALQPLIDRLTRDLHTLHGVDLFIKAYRAASSGRWKKASRLLAVLDSLSISDQLRKEAEHAKQALRQLEDGSFADRAFGMHPGPLPV